MSDLATLASQHHLSQHNRAKFGDRGRPVSAPSSPADPVPGCPVHYVPLAVHAPDLLRRLRDRQLAVRDHPRWWPAPTQPAVLRAPPPELQHQLSVALSEPLPVHTHLKTSLSHPINVSQIIPPESLLPLESHLTPSTQPSPVCFEFPCPCPAPPHPPHPRSSVAGVLNAALTTRLPSLLSLGRSLRVTPAPPQSSYALHPHSAPARPPTASAPRDKRLLKLGNLLLSSCPGKKVRLNGSVRGRSAVCRSLDVDMRRIKFLGARCVVCCLDDEELEFLVGVSWTEYRQVAHQQDLDVLRIPIPEGLAPLSPESLDADLDRIIRRYTLHGLSVLVHCRGGVGRAGVFACCWMLKLGLCGWIETDTAPPSPESEIKPDDTIVRRDTLQLVERAIEVVRRRRSAKAIETLEQVQFLVDYVDYLRTRGRADHS